MILSVPVLTGPTMNIVQTSNMILLLYLTYFIKTGNEMMNCILKISTKWQFPETFLAGFVLLCVLQVLVIIRAVSAAARAEASPREPSRRDWWSSSPSPALCCCSAAHGAEHCGPPPPPPPGRPDLAHSPPSGGDLSPMCLQYFQRRGFQTQCCYNW